MITLPCLDSSCSGRVVLPVEDDAIPLCPACQRQRPVRWVYSKGKADTKSYLNCFTVWRLALIKAGRIATGCAGQR